METVHTIISGGKKYSIEDSEAREELATVDLSELYAKVLELERKLEELINNGGGGEDVEELIKAYVDGFNATLEGKGITLDGENLTLEGATVDGDNLIIT